MNFMKIFLFIKLYMIILLFHSLLLFLFSTATYVAILFRSVYPSFVITLLFFFCSDFLSFFTTFKASNYYKAHLITFPEATL